MILILLKKIWANEIARYIVCILIGLAIGIISYPSKEIQQEKEIAIKKQEETKYSNSLQDVQQKSEQTINLLTKQYEEEKQKTLKISSELSERISTLINENSQLKSKRKVETVIIKDPSGREETKVIDTTEIESSSSKVQEITKELKQKYEEDLRQLEVKKSAEIKEAISKSESMVSQLKIELSNSTKITESLEKSLTKIQLNPKRIGIGAGYTTDKLYSLETSYRFWGPLYLGISGDSNAKDVYRGKVSIGVNF